MSEQTLSTEPLRQLSQLARLNHTHNECQPHLPLLLLLLVQEVSVLLLTRSSPQPHHLPLRNDVKESRSEEWMRRTGSGGKCGGRRWRHSVAMATQTQIQLLNLDITERDYNGW